MDSESEIARIKAEKDIAKIQKIADKYELSFHADIQDLLKHVIEGGYLAGLGTKISKAEFKDYMLHDAFRRMHTATRDSSKQRIFEFICQMLDLMPSTKQNIGSIAAEVVFDNES